MILSKATFVRAMEFQKLAKGLQIMLSCARAILDLDYRNLMYVRLQL